MAVICCREVGRGTNTVIPKKRGSEVSQMDGRANGKTQPTDLRTHSDKSRCDDAMKKQIIAKLLIRSNKN